MQQIIVSPMRYTNSYRGMLRYVNSRWPAYLLGLAAAILLLSLLLFSLSQGWYGIAFLSLAALIALIFFLGASFWTAHQIYDLDTIGFLIQSVHDIEPSETIVDVHVWSKSTAVWLSRLMTSGKVIAMDVYNPQLTPGGRLKRWRRSEVKPKTDPRLSLRDSDFNLLPLPDNCVSTVTVIETLSDFWQEGDREKLLTEIFRILKPGGRLILVEQMRTSLNLLLKGPSSFSMRPVTYWNDLLVANKFATREQETHRDIITCLLAIRPKEPAAEQFRLL